MSIESRWFGNSFGISGRQGMTWNDMQWESDWGRVYSGSEKRSALIGFDGFNICIAHCHLWDLGAVYWMYLNVLQIRVIIHEWLSSLEMSILQMRLAWHEEILWSLVKKSLFTKKHCCISMWSEIFWRRKFLQGRCSLWSSWTWHWSDTHLRCAKFIGARLLPMTHVRDCRLLLGQQKSVVTDSVCVDMM